MKIKIVRMNLISFKILKVKNKFLQKGGKLFFGFYKGAKKKRTMFTPFFPKKSFCRLKKWYVYGYFWYFKTNLKILGTLKFRKYFLRKVIFDLHCNPRAL